MISNPWLRHPPSIVIYCMYSFHWQTNVLFYIKMCYFYIEMCYFYIKMCYGFQSTNSGFDKIDKLNCLLFLYSNKTIKDIVDVKRDFK